MSEIMKIFVFFIAVFGVVSSRGVPHLRQDTILESPAVTNWGKWGPFENCSCGLVVTGFQLKVEPMHSGDNTAVNAVRFFCGVPDHPYQKEVKTITSSEGPQGYESEKNFCYTYAIGFQLESQSNRGEGGGEGGPNDDAATTNMKLICEDNSRVEGYLPGFDRYPGTEYTKAQICPTQMALCGLQTQLHELQGGDDDTQINNVRAKCCKVKKSASTPAPEEPHLPAPPCKVCAFSTSD